MRALALVFVVGCSSTPVADRASSPPITRPRVVAHRGASHDAPENTLAAFTRAWALGVECVELDVHLTRDGEVVVMHDANTKRTTGHDGPIADQTLAALKTLDAGRGERIPTIGEVIATIPRGRTLFVEIKSPITTVPAVAQAIRAANPGARGATIALQSFDPDTLVALSRALPDAPAYWTVDPPLDADHHPLPYPI
ncbi:MAG: glycerophosphodiester phosphodiesterase family protein, partial [Polyangiales bacterium]